MMQDDISCNGWLLLAEAIMLDYAEQYASQFPRDAISQQEYTHKDLLYYRPFREYILACVGTGPLRHIAVVHSCRRSFEQLREEYKKDAEVHWIG